MVDNKLFLLNPVTKPKETHSLYTHTIGISIGWVDIFIYSFFSEFQHWQNWFCLVTTMFDEILSRRLLISDKDTVCSVKNKHPFILVLFYRCLPVSIVLCNLESAISPSLRHRRVARLDYHCGDIIRAHCQRWNYLFLIFIPVVITDRVRAIGSFCSRLSNDFHCGYCDWS